MSSSSSSESPLHGCSLDHRNDDLVRLVVSYRLDVIRSHSGYDSCKATGNARRPMVVLPHEGQRRSSHESMHDGGDSEDAIGYATPHSHLLSVAVDLLNHNPNQYLKLDGAPARSKTIFGLLAVRALVRAGGTVLYWDEEQATMVSSQTQHIKYFGLSGKAVALEYHNYDEDYDDDEDGDDEDDDEEEDANECPERLHFAAWEPDNRKLLSALIHPEVYVVHDPGPISCSCWFWDSYFPCSENFDVLYLW